MEEKLREYVVVFSIGPVQEFIAKARKTRDLWFGSHLLSELSKKAAEAFASLGGNLIFPEYVQGSLWESQKVANKVTGVIKTNDPKQIALSVRRAVVLQWRDYSDKAKKRLVGYINEGMWKKQVNDFIEFYAAWSPITDSYVGALEHANQLLVSRKTLRDFKQNEPKHLYGDKKSPLDPGRESVLYPEKIAELREWGIKDGETLDAISLVKRLPIEWDGKFPSVCDVGFGPFIRAYKYTPKKRMIDKYYESLKKYYGHQLDFRGQSIDDYESALFYDSRIADFVYERMKQVESKEARKQITEEISAELEKFYTAYDIKRPANYYAFIVCDGDQMGKLLRQLTTQEEQQQFSRCLSEFARKAEEIVIRWNGQLIYSGGDDVMAYLPLQSCLQACFDLQQEFGHILKKVAPKADVPTLSIGLAIVHILERLEVVRDLAYQAEVIAKKKRNQLSILVHKRHGGTIIGASFSFNDSPTEKILDWKKLYVSRKFSAALPYAIENMYYEYKNLLQSPHLKLKEEEFKTIIVKEIERLFIKKKPNHLSKYVYYKEVITKAREELNVQESSVLEQLKILSSQMIMAKIMATEEVFHEEVCQNYTN